MTSDEIGGLKAARESLCRHRNRIAREVAGDAFAVALAQDLTTILLAIEAIDRALNETGHPYMSPDLRANAE